MIKQILTAVMVLVSASAFAQEKAPSLQELLRMVEQGRVRDAGEHRDREQRFAAAKNQQQQMLRQAQQQKTTAERRSNQLERVFEQNELRTADLMDLLDSRLGSLKELFGVLQQVTGDTRGQFEASVVSAQYPDRSEFLNDLVAKLGSSSKLASMEDIERLWFELQREMTESGKVAKFNTTVITADGEEVQQEVIRIGSFNVVADGKYLQYTPETGNVVELARQPQGRFVKTTSSIFDADPGEVVSFGLDPTRGSLLGLLVQAPNLRERIAQGGLIGYLIIALGALSLLIALERIVVLGISGRKVQGQLKSDKPSDGNPLGRVLKVAGENQNADLETLELKMGEAIIKEAPKLSRGLLFLKIISVIAPLMGLLGTVTGMINTFQAITLFGTGDPKLMAGGISQALVPTLLVKRFDA